MCEVTKYQEAFIKIDQTSQFRGKEKFVLFSNTRELWLSQTNLDSRFGSFQLDSVCMSLHNPCLFLFPSFSLSLSVSLFISLSLSVYLSVSASPPTPVCVRVWGGVNVWVRVCVHFCCKENIEKYEILLFFPFILLIDGGETVRSWNPGDISWLYQYEKECGKKKGRYERIRWTYQSLKLFKLFSNCCSLFMCV